MLYNTYEIVYWITGLFGLYAWFTLLAAFSESRQYPLGRIVAICGVYYMLNNVLLHYGLGIPIVNLILTISLLSALAFQMNFSAKKIAISVGYTMLILMLIDIVVALSTGFVMESVVQTVEYESVMGRFMTVILAYAIGVGVKNFKHINKDIDIPTSFWLTLITFPILSILIELILITFSHFNAAWVLYGTVILMGMNWIVFSLYNRLNELYSQRLQDMAAVYLSDSYRKQLEVMQQSVLNTRSVQHDIKRHVASLDTLVENGQYEEMKAYLQEIREEFAVKEEVAKTGNTMIDSIINFEIAKSRVAIGNVEVVAHNIPVLESISDYELTIIISNLVRNALQAAENIDEGHVTIQLQYSKGVFFMKVVNDYDGIYHMEEGKLISRHKQKENRGIGVANVRKVVEKYDGEMHVNPEARIFTVDLVLYT